MDTTATNEERLAAAHATLTDSRRQGHHQRGLAEPAAHLRLVPPLLAEQPAAPRRPRRRGPRRVVPHVEADPRHRRPALPDPQGRDRAARLRADPRASSASSTRTPANCDRAGSRRLQARPRLPPRPTRRAARPARPTQAARRRGPTAGALGGDRRADQRRRLHPRARTARRTRRSEGRHQLHRDAPSRFATTSARHRRSRPRSTSSATS